MSEGKIYYVNYYHHRKEAVKNECSGSDHRKYDHRKYNHS